MKSIFDYFEKISKQKGLKGTEILFPNKNTRAYQYKKSFMDKETYKKTSSHLHSLFLFFIKRAILKHKTHQNFSVRVPKIGKYRYGTQAKKRNKERILKKIYTQVKYINRKKIYARNSKHI